MKKFAQQTELEKKLAELVKKLENEIKKLPAYARRKKDEKNWETFFTILAFIALVGIVIFGIGGWMAVAITGALLTLITVESGLFLSIAIGFSAWPIYNFYLWTRDLFSSEKIKSQNKDYDQCRKNLIELKELAAKRNYLATEIDFKLNNAIKCFPSKLFDQVKADFVIDDLKDQIQRLEQEKKNHPAYSRKQNDKENWSKIFRYSGMASCVGLDLYLIAFIVMIGGPSAIALGPIFPALVVIEAIIALIIIGPVLLSSILHAVYLGVRDLFSSAKIKAENEQYVDLEKNIAELKKLDEQLSQLDEKINSKLQESTDANLVSIHNTDEKENNEKLLNKKYIYNVFQKPTPIAANQASVESLHQHTTKSM